MKSADSLSEQKVDGGNRMQQIEDRFDSFADNVTKRINLVEKMPGPQVNIYFFAAYPSSQFCTVHAQKYQNFPFARVNFIFNVLQHHPFPGSIGIWKSQPVSL